MLINENYTLFYSIKNKNIRQRKWSFVIRLKSLRQIRQKDYWMLLQKQLDAAKIASKNVVHKSVEATGELIGNKIAEKNLNENLCL